MMMMVIRTVPLLPMILMVLIPGTQGQEVWDVTYATQNLCALMGSAVNISCTYRHPAGLIVVKSFWLVNPVQQTDLLGEPDYLGRVRYFPELNKHTVRINDVRKTDERQYFFKFLTNYPAKTNTSVTGVTLRAAELQVSGPSEVTEGTSAILTCTTTCDLTVQMFVWYKNGFVLPVRKAMLHLSAVRVEDVGNYSCAVRGYEHLRSPAQSLVVRYPPRNIRVSVSSGEIVEGDSLILKCSSDAHPPVENYTWFKEGNTWPVGSGQDYSIARITRGHAGLYQCRAQNDVGAQNGTVLVAVVVLSPGRSVILYAALGFGSISCMVAVALSVAFCLRRKKTNKTTGEEEPGEDLYQNVGIRARNVPKVSDPPTQPTNTYHKEELLACPPALTLRGLDRQMENHPRLPAHVDTSGSSEYQNLYVMRNMRNK